MTFLNDLAVGQLTEEIIAEKLYPIIYGKDKITRIKNKSCDLKMELKIEVKTDKLAYSTGNIAIELGCNKKPSGILATEADIWMWKVKDYYFWALVTDIKNYIDEHGENYKVVMGGDGSRSKLAIVPVFDFIHYIAKPL